MVPIFEVTIRTGYTVSQQRAATIRSGLYTVLCSRTEHSIAEHLSGIDPEQVIKVVFFDRSESGVTVRQNQPVLGQWLVGQHGFIDTVLERALRTVVNIEMGERFELTAKWVFKGEGAIEDHEEQTDISVSTHGTFSGRAAVRDRMSSTFGRLSDGV